MTGGWRTRWLPHGWPGANAPMQSDGVERWLVVDLEASGLDPRNADVLAIAALGVRVDWARRRLWLVLGDSFSIDLRREAPHVDAANILVHGIGVGQQRVGQDPTLALRAFCEFAAGAPLLAFHADYDRRLLARQLRLHGLPALRQDWLDIAALCAVAHPKARERSLDEWLARMGIECLARHQAMADVLAECELMQMVWPHAAAECGSWPALRRYAARHRWLAASA